MNLINQMIKESAHFIFLILIAEKSANLKRRRLKNQQSLKVGNEK